MSKHFAQLMAGLEEFTEDVNSEIVADQPEDGAFDEETAGVDFPQESGDISADADAIVDSAQGLEDIINLVEDAPGEGNQPLEPFVNKAVNVALESNDLVAATPGGAVALTSDKGGNPDKDKVLTKIKDFAKKVWNMLREFGKKIAAWVRETWAKYTDRIVKNANHAKKIIEQVKTLSTSEGAKITDKGLLAKIASYKGAEVGDVMQSVSELANSMGGKNAVELTKECRTCIDVVSNGSSSVEGVMDRFLDSLVKSADGVYDEEASAAQAQAAGAAAGTKTVLSEPLFGGYRAWMTIPENLEQLKLWNHGISKVDEVQVPDSVPAPDGQEIEGIAKYIISLGEVVNFYKASLKGLDDLNRELDKAAGKSNVGEEAQPYLKQMQAIVPRIIKGPQVAAYAYATSASTIALQYCSAGIAAHDQRSVGEKVGDAARSVKEGAAAAADKAGYKARSAKLAAETKVKRAFGKDGE